MPCPALGQAIPTVSLRCEVEAGQVHISCSEEEVQSPPSFSNIYSVGLTPLQGNFFC